jgi:protein-glutamine gamma-glutamyltransferase
MVSPVHTRALVAPGKRHINAAASERREQTTQRLGQNALQVAASTQGLANAVAWGLKHASLLNASAVNWLERNTGDFGGQRRLYQGVLSEQLGHDVHLIDVNRRGAMDADVVALEQKNGVFSVRQLTQAQRDAIVTAAATVAAGEEVGAAGFRFQEAAVPTANPKYWNIANDRRLEGAQGFKLKPGMRPSEAMDDLFKNPKQYAFECGMANNLVFARALQKLMGNERFDKNFDGLEVTPTFDTAPGSIGRYLEAGGESGVPLKPGTRILPGEHRYMKNGQWDATSARDAAWQGENLTVLLKDPTTRQQRYQAHDLGVVAHDAMVQHLDEHRASGATTSAYLTDEWSRIHPGFLAALRKAQLSRSK